MSMCLGDSEGKYFHSSTSLMAPTQLWWAAIAALCVAGLVASDDATPQRDTDVVFVVQRRQGCSTAASANMKQFMNDFAAYYDENISHDDKVTVRFAAVHYDGAAQVAFDYDNGLYLNKMSQLNSAIDALELEAGVPGADLGGALTLAGNILAEQSQVYRNRFVIVITDGDMTGDQQTFQAAIQSVHKNYTTVFVVKIAGDVNPTFQANIDAIIEGDSDFMTEVDFEADNTHTKRDLQKRDHIIIIVYKDIIIIIIRTSIVKVSTTLQIGPCSKTCGVGVRFRREECDVFIGGRFTKYLTGQFYEYCCIVPCGGHGPFPPMRWCRSYPPINGQP